MPGYPETNHIEVRNRIAIVWLFGRHNFCLVLPPLGKALSETPHDAIHSAKCKINYRISPVPMTQNGKQMKTRPSGWRKLKLFSASTATHNE
jgi:hypothetical protein